MTEWHASQRERLTALLDGELDAPGAAALIDSLGEDPALRDSLVDLHAGRRAIAGALDGLAAAAPMERLEERLAAATAAANAAQPSALPPGRAWGRARTIAAVAIAGAIGLAAGVWLAGSGHEPPETWREAVAEYWALTTPDTIAIEPTASVAERELALVSSRLGLPLDLAALDLPNASFRGATLFDFGGRPLTQIAFLDQEHGPIAYCIIADPAKGEIAPTATTMDGFEVVHWSSGGFARMLIGRAPEAALRRHAERLIGNSG